MAGVKYDLNPQSNVSEFCRFDTVYRYARGFGLDTENLKSGTMLPPMTPLALDHITHKATPVINVKVVEQVAADGTEVKIAKKSLAYVGMFLGTGSKGAKVTAINTSNSEYDVLTIESAFGAVVKKDDVLFEASAVGGTKVKNTAIALNYAWVKVEENATVTAVGRAYEIKTSKLVLPISEKDKENLGDRFMFI